MPRLDEPFRPPTPGEQSSEFLILIDKDLGYGVFFWHPKAGLVFDLMENNAEAAARKERLLASGAPRFGSVQELLTSAHEKNWPQPTEEDRIGSGRDATCKGPIEE